MRSTQHTDPRTYFVIIDIDRVIREYGMSKRHLKASRLKYIDRQKALFDRKQPKLVDRFPGLLTGTLGNSFFEPLPEDELQQWE